MARQLAILCSVIGLASVAACRTATSPPPAARTAAPSASVPVDPRAATAASPWWNDRVFYEVFVRSFADSATGPLAGDGIGDFQGLIEKLDYLNDGNPATATDLGVTGIWLMPIHPSPSYHGYDVTDYYGINPQYGTRADFERFLAECRRRGIRVIVDLVLNHSSSEHPHFVAALGGDARYRDWYLFVEPDDVPQVRGPWNQQVWQKMHDQFYYGIFWSGMPDLNYRNPEVTAEARRIAEFWLRDLRVDGFRLDAVRHLVEDGIEMSDTPETLAWLREFRAHLKKVRVDALMVGEVWTGTEVVSEYVSTGALDLAFEFDLAEAILAAIESGRRDELAYTLANVTQAYPGRQFASFVTNHDQDRIASRLGELPGRLKLAASLLLAGPGVPFLYYGEEIGQVGAKPDEMIRNPMPWSGGAHAGFTSGAKPWERLQPGFERRNVATQAADPASLLDHYRRWIRLRQAEPALRRGDLQVIDVGRDDVIAFQRTLDGRTLTFVANLSGRAIEGLSLPEAAQAVVKADRLTGAVVAASAPLALDPYGVRLFTSSVAAK